MFSVYCHQGALILRFLSPQVEHFFFLFPSLARHLQKVQSAASADFTEDQKVFLPSINLCTYQFGFLYQLKVFVSFFIENHRKDCNMPGNEECQFAGLCFFLIQFKV